MLYYLAGSYFLGAAMAVSLMYEYSGEHHGWFKLLMIFAFSPVIIPAMICILVKSGIEQYIYIPSHHRSHRK